MEDTLRKLVAFPTVSGDAKAMHELLEYVADFVTQRGMHVVWFNSNGFESIVATVKPDHKTPKVMLGAHADVVPAESPMFTLRQEDGKYIGRGVLDMKFAIASYLQVIDDIQHDLEMYDIGLMITGDEEVGGRDGVAVLIDAGYLPQVCILPDGGDNWQIQTGSKGILIYEITVEGKSAHGSRPWLGDNAITKILGVLDEIAALFPKVPTPETNTISLTKIKSGKALSQIPNAAKMTLDVRTLNSREYQRLDYEIRQICKRNNALCTNVSDGAPTSFDLNNPLIAPFAALITEVTGQPMAGYFAMGASDARYYIPYGTPIISVYPTGGNIHGDDEWLDVMAFGQFRDILRQYLDEVALTKP
jgi:succinyl-diaminopimelate desuccinylase